MAHEVIDSLEINQNRQSEDEAVWKRPSSRQSLKILTICFGLVLIAFAFLGNKVPFGRNEDEASKRQFAFREKRSTQNGPSEEEIREAIFKTIDTKRIASTLRLLTKEPHVSGTEANLRVAQNIAQLWRDNGLEGGVNRIVNSLDFLPHLRGQNAGIRCASFLPELDFPQSCLCAC